MLDLAIFFSPVLDIPSEISNIDSENEPLHRVYSLSAGPDNGANALSFAYFSQFHPSPTKKHIAIAEASANVVSSVRTSVTDPGLVYKNLVILGGHGSPGGFDCGSGNVGYGEYNRISIGNPYIWKQILNSLGVRNHFNFRELQLFSCETGAEIAGANLVWNLAKTTLTNVCARTGLTYYQQEGPGVKMFFQNGSSWQIGLTSAASPPAPIGRTAHPFVESFELNDELAQLNYDLKIDLKDIESISVVRYSSTNKVAKMIISDDIAAFLTLLFSSPLFSTPGEIAGFLTAQITLQPPSGQPIVIDIYNDVIGTIRQKDCSFFTTQGLNKFISSHSDE